MLRVWLFLYLLISGYAVASDHSDHLDSLTLVNETKFSYMLWEVYDIALFDDQEYFDETPPYALKLTYLREFKGSSIADRSSKLIREQGIEDEIRLAAWHSQMDQIFPDVQVGDTLTGLYNEDKETVFFFNGDSIGRIQDPLFGEYFFGIWLGKDTTESRLRSQLIGSQDG